MLDSRVLRVARAAVAVVASLAAGAAGLVSAGSAVAADAAPTAAAVVNIDASQDGKASLTVHKYASGAGDWSKIANDGTEQTAPDKAQALGGVVFTAYRVNGLDLKTYAGWQGVAAATVKAAPTADNAGSVTVNGKDYNLVKVSSVTTNAQGVAGWSNQPLGLYYVVEDNAGQNKVTRLAAPFFVTLPYAKAGKDWNYAVHAYPKNDLLTATKTVDTTGAKKTGEPVSWQLENTVSKAPLTKFGAVDVLKDAELAYAPTAADDVNSGVTAKYGPTEGTGALTVTNGVVAGGTALAAGTDYTVTKTALTGEGKAGNTEIKINLTAAGLDKLNKAGNGTKVVFTLRTTVVAAPASGEVSNSFYPIENDYDPYADGGTPVDTTETPKYGKLQFTKVDDVTPAKKLAGAKFQLKDGNTVLAEDTSDANGVVDFGGAWILINRSAKGATNQTRQVQLVEVEAPAGYKLNATPVTVTLQQGKTVGVKAATPDNVTNTKSDVPDLPLTGAAGRVLMSLAGVALLAVAVVLLLGQRARNRQRA